MKLSLDQNLSPKLVKRWADLFPNSTHVEALGLDCADDNEVWAYALQHDFAIVSKDEDYNNLSVIRGCPPKVIWLLLGNCTTGQIEDLFRARHADILAFEADPNVGTLALG
jgi:predicted nuclease of predicted toxin-antitoxin system